MHPIERELHKFTPISVFGILITNIYQCQFSNDSAEFSGGDTRIQALSSFYLFRFAPNPSLKSEKVHHPKCYFHLVFTSCFLLFRYGSKNSLENNRVFHTFVPPFPPIIISSISVMFFFLYNEMARSKYLRQN